MKPPRHRKGHRGHTEAVAPTYHDTRIASETTHISRDASVGTISYMAPEALRQGELKLGRPSDIWSLGIILYQMVYRRSPFAHLEPMQRLFVLSDPNAEAGALCFFHQHTQVCGPSMCMSSCMFLSRTTCMSMCACSCSAVGIASCPHLWLSYHRLHHVTETATTHNFPTVWS